jgi:glutamate synthase (NADPH/NADH)
MASEGIVFKTNVELGKNLDATSVLAENDAVVMATGATWPRDLNIPGII